MSSRDMRFFDSFSVVLVKLLPLVSFWFLRFLNILFFASNLWFLRGVLVCFFFFFRIEIWNWRNLLGHAVCTVNQYWINQKARYIIKCNYINETQCRQTFESVARSLTEQRSSLSAEISGSDFSAVLAVTVMDQRELFLLNTEEQSRCTKKFVFILHKLENCKSRTHIGFLYGLLFLNISYTIS